MQVECASGKELLAMVIGGRNAETVAENVMNRYGTDSRRQWYDDADALDFLECEGVTERSAKAIAAALEMGRRIAHTKAAEVEHMNEPKKVFEYFKPFLADTSQENFYTLYLTVKNRLIGVQRIAIGNIAAAPVDIKEVMRWGIRYKAYGIILVHNHPSGDPTPSDSDIRLTRKFGAAAELLDMNVLDHVVIGRDKFASLHDLDIIEKKGGKDNGNGNERNIGKSRIYQSKEYVFCRM